MNDEECFWGHSAPPKPKRKAPWSASRVLVWLLGANLILGAVVWWWVFA